MLAGRRLRRFLQSRRCADERRNRGQIDAPRGSGALQDQAGSGSDSVEFAVSEPVTSTAGRGWIRCGDPTTSPIAGAVDLMRRGWRINFAELRLVGRCSRRRGSFRSEVEHVSRWKSETPVAGRRGSWAVETAGLGAAAGATLGDILQSLVNPSLSCCGAGRFSSLRRNRPRTAAFWH